MCGGEEGLVNKKPPSSMRSSLFKFATKSEQDSRLEHAGRVRHGPLLHPLLSISSLSLSLRVSHSLVPFFPFSSRCSALAHSLDPQFFALH